MRIAKIESKLSSNVDGKSAIARGGMVATAFPDATRAGVEMLEKGGNAIDAACAAALALGVCEPQASGLGGQTMAIIHIHGKTIAIDGSTRVPSLAHLSRFDKGDRSLGYRATTVPSTVAVLGHLSFYYGRLQWATIVEPAIRIAQEGYRITALQRSLQQKALGAFLDAPSRSGAGYYLKDGEPYDIGDLFIQPDLANCLTHLAENGPRSFYQGLIAQRIDDDMRRHDGFLRAEDLALIPWPVERKPIKRRYRSFSIVTLPPPAAGLTLLRVLMVLHCLPSKFLRKSTPQVHHVLAETFRKAFIYRTQRPYDPNTFPQVRNKKTIAWDLARNIARSIRDQIDPDLPLNEPPEEEDDGETTHLSAMDAEGNAVGITQSIELTYGAKVAADGLGFLYNNYMKALDIKDPSHPYYLRPNAIPWTSVAPAIVFARNQPWLVAGSPGSERIYSTVGQFLLQMFDRRSSMREAMECPRMHCSIGGKITMEGERFAPEIVDYLRQIGYKVEEIGPYSFYLGCIQAVMKCQSKEEFHGVADIRRDGSAAGPG